MNLFLPIEPDQPRTHEMERGGVKVTAGPRGEEVVSLQLVRRSRRLTNPETPISRLP